MKNHWKQYSKINPQREDGNRQIANDVFSALMSADLSGSEFRIIMAVISKTWGFGKDSDCISSDQFMQMTGLAERTVKKSIKSLKDKRVLVYAPSGIRVHHGSPLNEFLFNKHYDTWKTQGCTNVHGCTKVSSKGAQTGKIRVHDCSPTKENILKENIQKKEYSPDFLKFWSAYPKKSGSKANAFTQWKKLNGDKPDIETILAAIKDQIEWRGKARDGDFRPEWKDPERWIKGRMWEAELIGGSNSQTAHSPPVYTKFYTCQTCGERVFEADIIGDKCVNCIGKQHYEQSAAI